MSTVSIKDLEALVEQFRRSEWREMHLRIGDTELFLSTDGAARPPSRSDAPAPGRPSPVVESPASPPPAEAPSRDLTAGGQGAAQAAAARTVPPGWVQVRAPSLGSFYRAAKPGASAFTDVGAHVTVHSELCLIEVMKLFTTMRADVAGTVREIYAQDGDLVEFGQPLFLIEPDA